MKFTPTPGYFQVKETQEIEEKGDFQWEKRVDPLCIVKIVAAPEDQKDHVDKMAVVISSLIQKFEYKKQTIKVVSATAVLGYVEE